MVIDEQVLPLRRIWCLFEVYHTIQFSQSGRTTGSLAKGSRQRTCTIQRARQFISANFDHFSAPDLPVLEIPGIHDPIFQHQFSSTYIFSLIFYSPKKSCVSLVKTPGGFLSPVVFCRVLQEGRAGSDVAVTVAAPRRWTRSRRRPPAPGTSR